MTYDLSFNSQSLFPWIPYFDLRFLSRPEEKAKHSITAGPERENCEPACEHFIKNITGLPHKARASIAILILNSYTHN